MRVFRITAIVVFALLVLAVAGEAWRNTAFRKRMASQPICMVELEELPLPSRPSTNGLAVSYDGLNLTLPWHDLQISRENPVFVQRKHPDGWLLIILNRQDLSMLEGCRSEMEPDNRDLQRFVSGMTEQEFNTALLGVTPSKLRAFQNPFTARRLRLLLIMKQISLWRYSALYSFKTGHISGFQMGNPETDETVQLLLIRPDDETYTIRFSSPNDAGNVFTGKVSQDQINALLASIRIKEET